MTSNICTSLANLIACNPSPDNEMFKNIVMRALSSFIGSSGASGVVLPQKTIAFGSVGAAFTDTTLLDSTKKLSRLYVNNQTDSDVAISLDGGTSTHFTVPSGEELKRDLGAYTGSATTSVQMKYLTAAPTRGNVYIDGSY